MMRRQKGVTRKVMRGMMKRTIERAMRAAMNGLMKRMTMIPPMDQLRHRHRGVAGTQLTTSDAKDGKYCLHIALR